LGVEERAIFVPKLYPFLSRFLIPVHFFLEKNVVLFLLEFFFEKSVS
jgi:hypothetical protein